MDVSFQKKNGLPIPVIHIDQRESLYSVYTRTGLEGNEATFEYIGSFTDIKKLQQERMVG